MKRIKKHKMKHDLPETSSLRLKDNEEHDLAYYIHDRVELMHQVFSVIKSKELKAMIPQCVKNISLDDLQELCTEELLGISSKRLCAILDGAEPPSDTESSSSSPEQLETISLDSISSDEEILSQNSSKSKKHKHKKKSKSKHKRRDSEKDNESGSEEKSRASRAGLTVLELLELQARARAIRAQLQKDQLHNKVPEAAEAVTAVGSDDEVEIKEEPAEVVEISSEDEKPNIEQLQVQQIGNPEGATKEPENSKTITKRINDLVITVPQTKQTRKIKLNRSKVVAIEAPKTETFSNVAIDSLKNVKQKSCPNEIAKTKEQKKIKSKKKEKGKLKSTNKDGSDHDEITLQLSDTEKMDLLEDLDRKNYDNVSSSSKDSEDSSDTDNSVNSSNDAIQEHVPTPHEIERNLQKMDITINTSENNTENENTKTLYTEMLQKKSCNNSKQDITIEVSTSDCDTIDTPDEVTEENLDKEPCCNDEKQDQKSQIISHKDNLIVEASPFQTHKENVLSINNTSSSNEECEINNKKRKLSEGELSDRVSSETEANELIPEVVCVSDEEKTKKKKDKKSKKKSKRCSLKSANDKEGKEAKNINETKNDTNIDILTSCVNDDDINEILELSDDSSCCEVDGMSVLSKEPTTDEIEALSAKIDDTIRSDVINDEISEYKGLESEQSNAENISWKDRYLDSKKVKRVLKTSNILNAMRKKNIELKKKLEASKKVAPVVAEEKGSLEGTIDEYNTLEGSTKYVDPVSEKNLEENEQETDSQQQKEVTKEMEKDAKQLLKMYKKLLKYNDMNKKKDPNRKKKKKSKKNKETHKDKETSDAAPSTT